MAFIDSTIGAKSPLTDLPELEEDETALGEVSQSDLTTDEAPEREPMDDEFEGTDAERLLSHIDDINLARYLTQQRLDQIGMQCVEEYKIDVNSRADWEDTARAAMDLATQKAKPKTFPWPKASNIVFPLLTQAALEFHARAYPAIVPGKKIVKGVVWGPDTGQARTDQNGQPIVKAGPDGQAQPQWLVEPGEKRARADRVADHMSYQLLCEMPEWETQTDQALLQMPISGGFVRKTYYDPVEKRNVSLVVDLMNLVWNFHAPSFEAAPRHSEKLLIYPHEIVENERKGEEEDQPGMWLHYEYGPSGGADGASFGYDETPVGAEAADESAPHLFIEQHRRLDLDEDGYDEPYIVTVHLRSMKVVRIVARYDKEGIDANKETGKITSVKPDEQYTLYPFLPNLEGGSYPMGFGHVLRPLNKALNAILNQMIDAGTLQNAGGGFISDQLNAPSGQTLFSVGKFHRINTKGQSIKDAVLPLPFQGPSATLFQLFGAIAESAKAVASIQNVLTGEAAIANAPPTTILALIEQGMKVYTAIHKRIWNAETAELKKLYNLNRKHLPANDNGPGQSARYKVGDEWMEITDDDYRLGGGVEPVADPTMTTDMQRLGRAQLLMTFNGDAIIDQVEIRKRLFEAAQIERIDDLFTKPDQEQAQFVQQARQMEVARAQAELKRTEAASLKDMTQAYLNLAKTTTEAQGPQLAFVQNQMRMLELHIEATNAATRAAEVDMKKHDLGLWSDLEHRKIDANLDMAAMAADAKSAKAA